MGTRNLTMVISNGQTKVAQYGQWDGYPSGQGADCLKFLKSADLSVFKEKLNLVRFQTDEDGKEEDEFCKNIGAADGWMTEEQSKKYHAKYPMLNRDHGAKILQLIYENTEKAILKDASAFAYEGLFCEWAYVIDLDKETFEVYKGFYKRSLKKTERFYSKELKDGYAPVKNIKEYKLSNLPTEAVFIKECSK